MPEGGKIDSPHMHNIFCVSEKQIEWPFQICKDHGLCERGRFLELSWKRIGNLYIFIGLWSEPGGWIWGNWQHILCRAAQHPSSFDFSRRNRKKKCLETKVQWVSCSLSHQSIWSGCCSLTGTVNSSVCFSGRLDSATGSSSYSLTSCGDKRSCLLDSRKIKLPGWPLSNITLWIQVPDVFRATVWNWKVVLTS